MNKYELYNYFTRAGQRLRRYRCMPNLSRHARHQLVFIETADQTSKAIIGW